MLAPDVLWFAEPIDLGAQRAPRMPDLAVEVRSPATWVYDVGPNATSTSATDCANCGWPTPPAARCSSTAAADRTGGFDVHAELTAEQTLSSPLLPGFAAAVGELLPRSNRPSARPVPRREPAASSEPARTPPR